MITASNRPQLLKLRRFEVSKSLLTCARSCCWNRRVLQPNQAALPALCRQTHSVSGAPGVCPGAGFCSASYCFLVEIEPSCAICVRASWVLQNFKTFKTLGSRGKTLEQLPGNKCLNRIRALGPLGNTRAMGYTRSLNLKIENGEKGKSKVAKY